ncbi:MAG: YihY/virulence factor BrkB family protein [Cyclobacteriaceae bacterium]|nr:YihY/virulence factor BrkB family protein [Cyclobacteriaceae bacterium]MCH8515344.1 YihY/virulence factor BrkB family protein [Cyclobacteriaceae bacterium]
MNEFENRFIHWLYQFPRLRQLALTLRFWVIRYHDSYFYKVGKIFFKKVKNDEITLRAASVAFNFTLSIFPAIIFFFTLIPYFQIFIPDMKDLIMEFLYEVMPTSIYSFTSETIEDILGRQRGGLLTFGFIFSLFLATNGMVSLMESFNSIYKTNDKRGFVKMRWVATLLTFLLSSVVLFSIFLLIVGQFALAQAIDFGLLEKGQTVFFIRLGKVLLISMMFQVAISSIYSIAPAVQRRWHFFSYGSLLATFLSVIISFGFSYYINSFATYNKLYGSIGALIAVMIWFYMLAIILLVGFEINAAFDKEKMRLKKEEKKNKGK